MPDSPKFIRPDIVVIGGSAGALSAVQEIVQDLPVGFPAALFIVLHTSANSPGLLPQILRRTSRLDVSLAQDRETIVPGRIYVAPPDHHLLVKRAYVRVVRGPKENGFRPALDPLFRSAARAYGARVIGLVLSGGLNDGTHGLSILTELGGIALVQDPQEAMVPSMPLSAIQNVEVHRVVKSKEMAPTLVELVRGRVGAAVEPPGDYPDIAETGDSLAQHPPQGDPSPYTCPECGGALWEVTEPSKLLRFRCHVGHAYTAESLLAGQEGNLEIVLWSALRALEENGALRRRMSQRTAEAGLAELARKYAAEAEEIEQRAEVLRGLLQRAPERELRAAVAGEGGRDSE